MGRADKATRAVASFSVISAKAEDRSPTTQGRSFDASRPSQPILRLDRRIGCDGRDASKDRPCVVGERSSAFAEMTEKEATARVALSARPIQPIALGHD